MKHQFSDERHLYMLKHLSELPRKILSMHGHDNVTEFVLHDLCHPHCFNLKKAAYLVDNPDFDCLKGVAGFYDQEAFPQEDIWNNPKDFSHHMQQSSFNQQVRGFEHASYKKNHALSHDTVSAIAHTLTFDKPHFFSWDMKHDNTGILIYQKIGEHDEHKEPDIINGLSLLSFCPIF